MNPSLATASNKDMHPLLKTNLLAICFALLPFLTLAQKTAEPAGYVNPLIGTAPLEDLSLYGGPDYDPDPGEMRFSGLVYPGANLPHGLAKLSPLNEVFFNQERKKWRYGSGYFYPANTIVGFIHTNKGHWNYGNIPIMPTVGKLQIHPGTPENPDEGFRSRFSHEEETAKAGYYSVLLKDYDVKAELTTTRYVGFHRYTFPETEDAHVIIDMGHAIEEVEHASVEIIDERTVRGVQNSVYFYAVFSKPFKSHGTWKGKKVSKGSRAVSGINTGAYLDYSMSQGEQLHIKVGLSFVSTEKARKNLEVDAADLDFDAVRANAWETWNDKLKMIEIEGGTKAQRTNFYTSLYRALLWPPVISDVDGEYRDGDQIHFSARKHYAAPPLWDAFRNHMPLLSIIEPEVKLNILRSFVERADRSGWMGIQFQGNHAASVFASSYLAGLDDFDAEMAYYYLKKNQTDTASPVPYLDEFMNQGFIATLGPVPEKHRTFDRAAVAKTLEYSYDAYCMAMMADKLYQNNDTRMFLDHARHYKNIYDPSTGFMRGKRPGGTWVEPFDPQTPWFTYMCREASIWQTTWFVPHDVQGLIELMGGRDAFAAKLDEFFSTPFEPEWSVIDVAGMIGQYAHSNQPDHQAPYLYDYAGQPWKTQEVVREIMDKMYRGLVYTGMDDCGEMASWYVWSAMGFYPVSPVHLTYPIGSPLFDKVTIHLSGCHYEGKDFVIRANNTSRENKYIQSATLNGEPYDKPWISYKNVVGGDEIVFEMGPEPNKEWGSEPENVPPGRPVK